MLEQAHRLVFLNPLGTVEIILLALLFSIFLSISYLTARKLTSRVKVAALLGLRALGFALLAALLLGPAIRTERYREDKPRLAVLVDSSYSMSLPTEAGGVSRARAVGGFIEKNRDFFERLNKDYAVSYYTFDKELRLASIEALTALEPRGKSTLLLEALKELGEGGENGGRIDAALLISDGADDGTSKKTRALIDEIPYPVYTVSAAGSGNELKDIWVQGLRYATVSFLRKPIQIEVELGARGLGLSDLPVTLSEGGELIGISPAISRGMNSATASFQIKPKTAGRKVYTVSIPEVSGDSVPQNNTKSFVVDVLIDKIRVLLIAGRPSWDARFLRNALKRNPNVDLVQFFILKDPTDIDFAAPQEMSLIPFPVNALFGTELDTFDVVIFQNFHGSPFAVSNYHLSRLKNYVEQKGGAFVMVGGDHSFDGGMYGRTPIADVLPVELSPLPLDLASTYVSQPTRLKLSRVGRRHPVTQILPNRKRNAEGWEHLPALEGHNRVTGIKRDAIPLMTSPAGEPIVVLGRAGRGKTASLLTDSTWKWSFHDFREAGEGDYYDKFWSRLLLWLVNDPELHDLKVSVGQSKLNPGDRAEIGVWALGAGGEKGEKKEPLKAAITNPEGTITELELQRNTSRGEGGEGGEFAAQIEAGKRGVYRVEVREGGGNNAQGHPQFADEVDETAFLVEPPEREIMGETSREALLRQISEKSGGSHITLLNNPRELGIRITPKRTLVGYRTEPVWDSVWILLLIAAVFSSEFVLRRRWGLK